jgi:hypothetical protein
MPRPPHSSRFDHPNNISVHQYQNTILKHRNKTRWQKSLANSNFIFIQFYQLRY